MSQRDDELPNYKDWARFIAANLPKRGKVTLEIIAYRGTKCIGVVDKGLYAGRIFEMQLLMSQNVEVEHKS